MLRAATAHDLRLIGVHPSHELQFYGQAWRCTRCSRVLKLHHTVHGLAHALEPPLPLVSSLGSHVLECQSAVIEW